MMEKSGTNCLILLTQKQRIAAQLIGCGHRQKEVADKVGVTSRTLRNWLDIQEFRQACDLFWKERSNELAYQSNQTRTRLTDALLGILENDHAEDANRIRAGKLLLDSSLILRQTKPQYSETLFDDPEEPMSAYERGRNDFHEGQLYQQGIQSAIRDAKETARLATEMFDDWAKEVLAEPKAEQAD